MKRVLERNEELLIEDDAEYIGGSSKVLETSKGVLVLTNKKLVFERIVGGVRHRRPEIIFIINLSSAKELKLGEPGRFAKPVLTVVYEAEDRKLEQPSFAVSSPERWSSVLGTVKIGGFAL
ncbi:MAG: hypothetical protein JTT11_04815 [Candidatus Brockarchaeota archaeon]|nr:hypothetical protein [Candidatus Brockarchaeota archaeon]